MTAGVSSAMENEFADVLREVGCGNENSLGISAGDVGLIKRSMRILGSDTLSLGQVWEAFEPESSFDELTPSAFWSILSALTAPNRTTHKKDTFALFLQLYEAIRRDRGGGSGRVYTSFPDLLSALLCFVVDGTVVEKCTMVYQLFDQEGNNSISSDVVKAWVENVELFCGTMIGNGAQVRGFAQRLWGEGGGLKGKINLSKFLGWKNNPVQLLHDILNQP